MGVLEIVMQTVIFSWTEAGSHGVDLNQNVMWFSPWLICGE